jgi:hypothetical protein
MAGRLTGFQQFTLIFQSPWNLAGVTNHRWSHAIYVSGTISHSDADAEAAALALAQPALNLASSGTSLVEWKYYPSGSTVAASTKTYAPGINPGTGQGYTNVGDPRCQLEVAAIAHGDTGRKNNRGKDIFLRHYFHDVCSMPTDPNTLGTLKTGLLDTWIHGAGPHAVVPVSPSTGVPAQTWAFESHLYTHQLRKGKKKKKPVGSVLLTDAENLVKSALQAKGLATLAEEIAAAL